MSGKAERTKQFIIEQTAAIFNRKGYAGTSMNDLVEATGLTKGSIYGNFENKDEVALAAFDYNFETVNDYIKSKMKERSTVTDQLLVYPETYRNFMKLPFLYAGCPILNTAAEADDTHPLLKEKAANALAYWRSSVERHVLRGIEIGEFKADANPAQFASVLMALVHGAVIQAKVSGKLAGLSSAMDFLEQEIQTLKK